MTERHRIASKLIGIALSKEEFGGNTLSLMLADGFTQMAKKKSGFAGRHMSYQDYTPMASAKPFSRRSFNLVLKRYFFVTAKKALLEGRMAIKVTLRLNAGGFSFRWDVHPVELKFFDDTRQARATEQHI